MTIIAVVSRFPFNPHIHIEGTEYASKKHAERYISLFKDRAKAEDTVQKKHGFDIGIKSDKLYSVAELVISNEFCKDN